MLTAAGVGAAGGGARFGLGAKKLMPSRFTNAA
jgi:hypothetical protein